MPGSAAQSEHGRGWSGTAHSSVCSKNQPAQHALGTATLTGICVPGRMARVQRDRIPSPRHQDRSGSRCIETTSQTDEDLVVGGADPLDDLHTLELELVLADVDSIESQLPKRQKMARADKSLAGEVAAMEAALEVLSGGTPLYRSGLPADVRAGHLLDQLPAAVATAPAGSTIVVFHTAVLAYLSADEKAAFTALVARLPVRWVSQEGAAVLSGVGERLPAGDRHRPAQLVLALDGEPVARTAPHGGELHWLPGR